MFKYRITVWLMFVSLIFCPPTATAVEIQITSGSLFVPHVPDLAHPFELLAPSFSFRGGGSGDNVSASFFHIGLPAGFARLNEATTLDGQLVTNPSFNNLLRHRGEDFPFTVGSLTFSTASVPLVLTANGFNATAIAPFTMTGTVTAYNRHPFFQSDIPLQTLQTFSLSGLGTAAASFRPLGDPADPNLFVFTRLRYTFEGPLSPSAIPEPSTALLAATGLLGLAIRRWRRS